jgi:hypothetical protein
MFRLCIRLDLTPFPSPPGEGPPFDKLRNQTLEPPFDKFVNSCCVGVGECAVDHPAG